MATIDETIKRLEKALPPSVEAIGLNVGNILKSHGHALSEQEQTEVQSAIWAGFRNYNLVAYYLRQLQKAWFEKHRQGDLVRSKRLEAILDRFIMELSNERREFDEQTKLSQGTLPLKNEHQTESKPQPDHYEGGL